MVLLIAFLAFRRRNKQKEILSARDEEAGIEDGSSFRDIWTLDKLDQLTVIMKQEADAEAAQEAGANAYLENEPDSLLPRDMSARCE